MDWKQELLKKLDAVASKLGTTTQYLWMVLVKQGYAEAISDGIFALFLFGVAYVAWWTCKKYHEMREECVILVGGVGVVALCSGVLCLSSCAKELFNPEYFALQQILQAIK